MTIYVMSASLAMAQLQFQVTDEFVRGGVRKMYSVRQQVPIIYGAVLQVKWRVMVYKLSAKVLYDILGSPQSRDLGQDILEFQVVVRNLEIDMRLVSPPDGHSECG